MNIVSGFADISIVQLSLVAGMALFASVIGGLAGYGTGALMPLVLVPLIGAEPVVPIIAISAIFANISRFVAYFRYAGWPSVATSGSAIPDLPRAPWATACWSAAPQVPA